MNSVDLEEGADEWTSPKTFSAWLAARGLRRAGTAVGAGDLARARLLREALRDLLAAHQGGTPSPSSARTLSDIARRTQVTFAFDRARGTLELEPRTRGTDAVFARVLSIVHEAMLQGTWPRLKVCRKHTCRWAFYDYSKNRSATWCSMAVCGNRVKAARRRSSHAQ